MQNKKLRGLILVKIVYIMALLAGYATTLYFDDWSPLWKAAIGDVAATIVVFLFSHVTRNASLYDPFWSVVPMWLVAYWLFEFGISHLHFADWIMIFLLVAWGSRLTLNWWTGWPGMHHQDWRYVDLKKQNGNLYWLVNLTGIHLFPTVLVFMGCLPMYAIIEGGSPQFSLGIMSIAIIITAGAIILEGVADWQRRTRFRQPEGAVYRSGLWSVSRHPNYLGEILFWVGLFVAALAHGTENYWTGIGALSMIILFVFISIPMMEKRQLIKDGYRQYQDEVAVLIPGIRW